MLLERLFGNLIQNAVTYGRSPIEVELGPDGEHVVVSVADSGDGIPEEALPRIFDRFYRADKARSRHMGGVGLGLSICKYIVALHGGTITAANAPAGGAVFTVRLPCAAPDSRPPAGPRDERAAGGPPPPRLVSHPRSVGEVRSDRYFRQGG